MNISQLQQDFDSAIASEEMEEISKVLNEFDQFCRQQVESQTDIEQKRQLIISLIAVEKRWQEEILQFKAKVRGKIADIKSNTKKINKYLTSF